MQLWWMFTAPAGTFGFSSTENLAAMDVNVYNYSKHIPYCTTNCTAVYHSFGSIPFHVNMCAGRAASLWWSHRTLKMMFTPTSTVLKVVFHYHLWCIMIIMYIYIYIHIYIYVYVICAYACMHVMYVCLSACNVMSLM